MSPYQANTGRLARPIGSRRSGLVLAGALLLQRPDLAGLLLQAGSEVLELEGLLVREGPLLSGGDRHELVQLALELLALLAGGVEDRGHRGHVRLLLDDPVGGLGNGE